MTVDRRPYRGPKPLSAPAFYSCANCGHNWAFHEGLTAPVDGTRCAWCRGRCDCKRFWSGDRRAIKEPNPEPTDEAGNP